MLSILIPVYNFNITNFVNDLHKQCSAEKILFEIICIDDGSSIHKESNSKVSNFNHVVYKELPTNIGRSKIRNLLAQEAKYDWLLFVDCDSQVNDDKYISNYISNLNKAAVLYGGRSYLDSCAKAEKLRWLYGTKRETNNTQTRNLTPYLSFMSNNFCISKEVFLRVKMDESITEYGHEDTLFGKELEKENVSILHIDNNLTHIGLETAEVFLEKTKSGVKNLGYLYRQKKIGSEVKLIRTYSNNKFLLKVFLLPVFSLFKRYVIANLKSESPSLIYFDIFKLYYFTKYMS